MPEPLMMRHPGGQGEIQLARWAGSGPTVLCVHGLTANCRCWDQIAGALAPACRVIAMDLRGRGLTGPLAGGCSVANHVQDIAGVIDALGGRPVLMGHSLGALIVLAFAARYPTRVDRIVLVDGAGALTADQMEKVLVAIKPALDRLGKVLPSEDAYLDLMKKAPFLHPWSPVIEGYFRYEIEAVAGGVRSRVNPDCIGEEIAHLSQLDVAALYPKVRCPVLILRATRGILTGDDLVLPEPVVRDMLLKIPHATRVDLPDTNHYTIVFHPNRQRDQAINDFLR